MSRRRQSFRRRIARRFWHWWWGDDYRPPRDEDPPEPPEDEDEDLPEPPDDEDDDEQDEDEDEDDMATTITDLASLEKAVSQDLVDIVFDQSLIGRTITFSNNLLNVTGATLTIDGTNIGALYGRLRVLLTSNVTISNLRMAEAYGDTGSSLAITHSDNVTINNCSIMAGIDTCTDTYGSCDTVTFNQCLIHSPIYSLEPGIGHSKGIHPYGMSWVGDSTNYPDNITMTNCVVGGGERRNPKFAGNRTAPYSGGTLTFEDSIVFDWEDYGFRASRGVTANLDGVVFLPTSRSVADQCVSAEEGATVNAVNCVVGEWNGTSYDFRALAAGDVTEIGDGTINISGTPGDAAALLVQARQWGAQGNGICWGDQRLFDYMESNTVIPYGQPHNPELIRFDPVSDPGSPNIRRGPLTTFDMPMSSQVDTRKDGKG